MDTLVKALVLMSGGLDSMLAAKILERQGVKVTPVCFESYFFSCEPARKAALAIGMSLRVEDISQAHLVVVKKPNHGRGASVNPCIDCHLLMLKVAKRIMDTENFDLIATGEVIGQRPMSQNRQSLDTIEREAGLAEILLRPLSAKLLPETESEKRGLVDRSKLYGISGRARNQQLGLAKEFGISYIPQPGGGCILTEIDYGRKLNALAAKCPNYDGSDARILRFGRPIWENGTLFMIARNQSECHKLVDLAKPGDLIIEPNNFPGPVALVRCFGPGLAQEAVVEKGKNHILRYSKNIPARPEIILRNV